MKDKLNKILDRYRELEKKMSHPDNAFDPKKIAKVASEKSEMESDVKKIKRYFVIEKNITDNNEIISSDDEELKEIAQSELSDLQTEKEALKKELEYLLIPHDLNDKKNVIMEIRPAAGGDESELFAAEMLRMYLRYAENNNFKTSILSHQTTGINGIKYVAFEVKGNKVYSFLKYESGVHRVQRIPKTESQGRVHTSTITVAVLPEAEESDIEIKPDEIRVDVFRSSGPGGQSVNTTDSAVRITHIPTNTTVTCQDEKSQHKNKAKALNILRSRLLQTMEDEQTKERGDARKSQIGTGDRSEKIRTYNFPQDRITDHRISKSWHNLPKILDGDIGPIIKALAEEDKKRKLKNQ